MKRRTTHVMILAVSVAVIMALFFVTIGRYDLAAIVAVGNLPAAAFLIYRLRNDL